jgi:hypothetical protein
MNLDLWVLMIFHSAIAFGNSTDSVQVPETSVIKETRVLTDEEQPFHLITISKQHQKRTTYE